MANSATVTWPGRSIFLARMRGLGTEPIYIGWGDSAVTASANSDVGLFKQQTEARATGTPTVVSTSFLGDTWQLTGLITNLVAGKTITEAMLYDSVTQSASATATLVVSLGAAQTVATISAASPLTGRYYRQIENEVVLVSIGMQTTVETLVRSQLGSVTAAHAIAAWTAIGGDGGAFTNFGLGNQTATQAQFLAAQGSGFAHADFAGIALSISDAINFTWKDELT